MNNDDPILKRIIKAYLHQHGEATAKQIAVHIQTVGYGFKKQIITRKIKYWNHNEVGWLRIRWYKNKNNILTFYLKK